VQPDNPASIREGAPGYSQVISRHLSKNSARIDMVLAEAGVREAARLIRSARLRDMLAAIEAWDTSHGPERAYWASQGSHLIRQWRRLYPHYWEAAA
jgi:hypothetical protein